MSSVTQLQKRSSSGLNAKVGRPAGSKTATPHDRIRRNARRYLEALDKSALAGNAEAVRLCLEIAAHPEQFPLPAE